jgi:single-strand DNA-binding protein
MDLNRYITTGNLTQDPELRELPSGTSVCQLRIANNGLGRGDREAVGYLTVSVYGKAGENCQRYLGSPRRRRRPARIPRVEDRGRQDALGDRGRREHRQVPRRPQRRLGGR